MRLFKRWSKAFGEILRAVDHLPAKQTVPPRANYHAAASRARAILERIRRGEYEFSSVEITEILKHNNWLGCRQSWFESVKATGDGMVEVRLQVPVLGEVSLVFWFSGHFPGMPVRTATLSDGHEVETTEVIAVMDPSESA